MEIPTSTETMRTLPLPDTLVRLLFLLCASAFAGVVRADTALRLELEDLVDRAELVVLARVLTARGVPDPSGIVCTDYSLEVSRTFLGEHLPARTIRLPGGVLPDGSGTLLSGFPRLREGEEVVLCLSAPGRTGWRVPVGAAQGAFFVASDALGVRRVGRRLDGLTRVAPAPASGPSTSPGAGAGDARAEYASFADRVERAVAAKLERRAAEDAAAGDGR